MLNGIFVTVVLGSILMAAFTGRMEPLTQACIESAKSAVDLALGLVGVMALFLGLMRVASDAGLLRLASRAIGPVMRRLFPSVPAEHPAMSAMLLNIASNMLGLGNAATPFGVKAMMELDKLNGQKGTATDAMVLFLAINTSGLSLLPTNVIGLRASAGSKDAAGIFFTTWFASGCATVVAIAAALLLAKLPRYRATAPAIVEGEQGGGGTATTGGVPHDLVPSQSEGSLHAPRWGALVAGLFALSFLAALVVHLARSAGVVPPMDLAREVLSYWLLPALVAALVLFGWSRGVAVYTSLVEGAKEGFWVAVRILPYLVAILVMVGLFRASGGMELLVRVVGPLSARVGMPAEALPMAVLRPLSGSGALGVMSEILRTHGPDSFLGYLVSTIQGCTETTFYVLAVYFGAVSVKRTRHALPACLLADAAGILASVFIVNVLYGHLR